MYPTETGEYRSADGDHASGPVDRDEQAGDSGASDASHVIAPLLDLA
jgi:hypothetical protein